MRHPYLAKLWFLLLFMSCGFLSTGAYAQSTGSVSGRITDDKQDGVPGATVLVDGTTLGSSTNVDGTFNLQSVPAGTRTLVISFVGYNTVRVPVTVVTGQNTVVNTGLTENTTQLAEAVVVGYGTQRRQDVTGSITTVDSKQFVKGQVTNPEQLVQGKVAGVQITTGGGAPGTGSQILIRGGSSLNASNQPLIVIDGVPVDNTNIAGGSNPLTQINPSDIESITVLKDASSTAIYGVRASNGVIIVTTKKGLIGEPIHVNVSTQQSIATVAKYAKVLTGDQLRALVAEPGRGTSGQIATLGKENTDWQREIFRNAYSADNNVSISGATGQLPYRASLGYLYQEGLLKRNDLKRYTGSLSLNPVLLDGNLRVNVNVRGSWIDNNFSNQGAVGNAVSFDPTQPVTASGADYAQFGGYYQSLGDRPKDGSARPILGLSPLNPVALIEQTRDRSTVRRSIGNIQLDYKIPYVPGLSANLNLGYDVQRGNGTVTLPFNSAVATRSYGVNKGQDNMYQQGLNNRLLETYGKYQRTIGPGHLELLAGYSYQRFENLFYSFPQFDLRGNVVVKESPANQITGASSATAVNVLLSYYSRLNYNIGDKYLFTGTIRRDETSRFQKGYRVGYFPSGAFAWRIKGEDFLKNNAAVSDLKLRLGYGQTGQQEVGGFYPSQSSFSLSGQGSFYQQGYKADGTPNYVQTLRPNSFNPGITWETTTTYNVGMDYGFVGGRVYGSVDVYQRDTKNLLNFTNIQVGAGVSNAGNYNIGSLTNKGVEAVLNVDVVKSDRLNITVNTNATYNRNRLTKLTLSDAASDLGSATGGISGGVGNNIQINTVGYPTQSFYAQQQVYGPNGLPLQGVYVDRNGDGTSDSKDLYRYKSPRPDYILGAGANIGYRGLNLAFSLRANLGNYVYNNVLSQAFYDNSTTGFVRNSSTDVLNTRFNAAQYFSDYFIENASFLRMDNATLGYNFGDLVRKGSNLNLTFAVQNVFIVTKYKGLDPEVIGGIDNTIYPRPRTFTVGLNIGI